MHFPARAAANLFLSIFGHKYWDPKIPSFVPRKIKELQITRFKVMYLDVLSGTKSGGVGAVVRCLPSNPKVPGSIPGSAETGIFGDLLSR